MGSTDKLGGDVLMRASPDSYDDPTDSRARGRRHRAEAAPSPELYDVTTLITTPLTPVAAAQLDGAVVVDWDYFPPAAPPTRRRQPPAKWGWRACVGTLTGGVCTLKPGPAEIAHRQAVTTIRATLPASRLVIVANEKGGAGKTPASIVLAATIAQLRSESNVVWDVNEMRGSLGLRAEVAWPTTTILDILANADHLARVDSNIGDLLAFLRRQPEGHLVLASTDDGDAMRQISYADCELVLRLLQRRFGLVIGDTGNNAAADTFRYTLDSADVLVIPAHPSPAHLAPARKLLAAIAAREQTRHLIGKAVLLITSHDGARMHEGEVLWFTERGVRVFHVPADPVIAANGPIPLADLSQASRRAWTLVAAAVIEAASQPGPRDRMPRTVPAQAAFTDHTEPGHGSDAGP